MFTVDAILRQHYPRFATQYPHLQGMEFVEQVLETFECTAVVADRERENIPASGRVMIVANHPIGTLDGLALLRLVHCSRPDMRIVANDLLETIKPLLPCMLSVKVKTGITLKEQIASIDQALANEEAVIIFPAGEVSRLGRKGIPDGRWGKGFLRLAARAKVSIFPIHIRGRNSISFYAAFLLIRPLSTLMLIGEMFRRQHKPLTLTIGALIPYCAYDGLKTREQDKAALFYRHLYRIGAGKKGNLPTETAIARPERRIVLKKMCRQGGCWAKHRTARGFFVPRGGGFTGAARDRAAT